MASIESMADEDLFKKDVPELLVLIEELKAQLLKVTPSIENLESSISNLNLNKGIDFFEAKVHVFLDYIINVVLVILLKVDGHSINDHPSIERLVETRTILEKMKPIEQKLSYQVDKLVKLAKTGSSGSRLTGTDPLSFKPNPGNMESKIDEESDSSEDEKTAKGIYVPPKVSAVPYEEGTTEGQKRKLEDRAKMKFLNKSLLKELREEYSENPEEVKDSYRTFRRGKNEEKDIERERYEEENLIRLGHGKKGKTSKNESSLKELTKFDSFGFGSDSDPEEGRSAAKRHKKFKPVLKGKKKVKFAGKKRRKFKK